MNLLRFLGRSLLASYFIANGAKAISDPAALAPETNELADKLVPLAKKVLPEQVGDRVPEDTQQLIKIGGIAQVTGGVMLATGIGRRLGASVLVGTMIPQLIHKLQDEESKSISLKRLLDKDVLVTAALTGAAVLASQDTQGAPSMSWRAKHQAQQLSKATSRYAKRLEKKANKKAAKAKAKALKKQAKRAMDKGADLLDSVTDKVHEVIS